MFLAPGSDLLSYQIPVLLSAPALLPRVDTY